MKKTSYLRQLSPYVLTTLMAFCLTALVLTSCSKDEDEDYTYSYSEWKSTHSDD